MYTHTQRGTTVFTISCLKPSQKTNLSFSLPEVFPGAEQQDFPDSERSGRELRPHNHPGEREGHGSGPPWGPALPAPPAGNLRLRQPAGLGAAVLQLRRSAAVHRCCCGVVVFF